tara:strand:- start:203 stop:517 length:315 start_codon:yes stop_codon:yes gene_type:complete
MEEPNKTKEQQWHADESKKWKEELVGGEEEGKIYPEPTDPDKLKSKYSPQNPYGEEMFSDEDFKVQNPMEPKEEEYIKVKKSWLISLRDYDTWNKWKNNLTEYK